MSVGGMTKRWFLALGALAVLACAQGCGDSARPVETPAASSALVAAAVPTATPSPTSTPSLTPTPTSSPTSTPSPNATPTPIPAVTPQSEPPSSASYSMYAFGPCTNRTYKVNSWFLRHRFVQWTPDGSHILFNWRDPLEYLGGKIYATDPHGSRISIVQELPFDPNHRDYRKLEAQTSFGISSDGRTIAYATCKYRTKFGDYDYAHESADDYDPTLDIFRIFDHQYDIATSNFDSADTRRLTENSRTDNYPVWSPDGTRIAFLSSARYEEIEYDGYVNYRLVQGGPGFLRYAEDGREYPGAYDGLYTMASDGSDMRTVADLIIAPYPPVWSPDGAWIAFVAEEAHPDGDWRRYPPKRWAIYVVMADGSSLRRLSDAVSPPSWSPDGRRIAFARAYGQGAAIFTIGIEEFDQHLVTEITERIVKHDDLLTLLDKDDLNSWIDRVLWSPDGSKIAFTCTTVCVVDVHGSSIVQSPIELPGWSIPSWSPDGARLAVLFAGPWYSATGRFLYPGAIVGDDFVPGIRRWERIQLYTMSPDGTDVQVLVRGDLSLVAENAGWRDVDVSIESCAGGYVVPDPEKNPGLVVDCAVLVSIRDILVGKMLTSHARPEDGTWSLILNWHGGMPIDQWAGITVSGSPPRVTALQIPPPEWTYEKYYRQHSLRHTFYFSYILRGVLPPELGMLTKLKTLDLSGNLLLGGIPAELKGFRDLEILELPASLSGCVPVELPDIWVRASGLEQCPSASNGKEAE